MVLLLFVIHDIGTGKTSTLTKLIQCLVACNCRVQAVAPTNVAICELARRYRDKLTLNNSDRSRLREMIVLGRLDRLKIEDGDDLADVHFDARVECLQRAFLTYSNERMKFNNTLKGQETSFEDFGENVKSLHRIIHDSIMYAPPYFVKGKRGFSTPEVQSAFAELTNISEAHYDMWRSGDTSCPPQITQCAIVVQSFLARFNLSEKEASKLKLLVLHQANAIFSTVSTAGRDIMSLVDVDVVIVDEATQMVQAETALVMKKSMRCLVLAGDDQQLPATVLSSACKRFGYDESLFSRLIKNRYESSLLNIQYRMHPLISSWPSQQFYSGNILDGKNVLSASYSKTWHKSIPPLSVYDVRDGSEERHEYGSIFNEVQATVVRKLIGKLTRDTRPEQIRVGIVSPYREQVNLLSHLDRVSQEGLSVKTGSIDGFQGQEFDIIILTTVRSNERGEIGFLNDLRRLNVGITRARFALIVVCDIATLSRNETWKAYLDYAKNCGTMFNSFNCKLLKETAQDVSADAKMFSELTDPTLSSEIFERAPWRSIFASDLKTSLTNMNKELRQSIVKRIHNISYGKWPKREHSHPAVSEKYRHVIHVYRVLSRRLVWSVDVNQTSCTQCIKLWDVVNEEQLSKCIRKVESSLTPYSDAYLKRCAFRKSETESAKINEPFTFFPVDVDFQWYVRRPSANAKPITDVALATPRAKLEQRSVKESSVLTKFYELTTNVARLLASSVDLQSIELPFAMSKEEEHIVRANQSMFILGRSGTGMPMLLSFFVL
jgi:hypothetical protein